MISNMESPKNPPKDEARKQTMLFAQLIEILTQNAIMMLGGMQDRQGRQRPPDLNAAELMIEILSVVQTKTKGNLTAEEEKMLSSTLYQLQTAFADVASKSGDFGKARKAAEAIEAADLEEDDPRPSPAKSHSPPPTGSQSPASKPQGIQSASMQSAETKVKFTKKYA